MTKKFKLINKIVERIEDIERAKEELNNKGNLSKEHFEEFNVKISTLTWVLKRI